MSTLATVRSEELPSAGPRLRDRLQQDPAGVLKDRGVHLPSALPLPVLHEFARVVSLLWVEGRIVPLDEFHLDPSDEGLLFGRGVWESTRTVVGSPWLWPLHIERLLRSAEQLCIDLAPRRVPDSDQVSRFVHSLTGQDVVVRLNVTAGRPGKAGAVWMSAAPLPIAPRSLRLQTRPSPVQKGQPYLMLKTFQYATRLRLGQEASRAGFDSALLVDTEGNLLEAAHANLFVRLEDGWATPVADGGLLPGTVRQHLLSSAPLPIRERPISCALLDGFQEAFVTNSNVGIVPVTQIDEHMLPIGNDTQALARWLQPPLGPGVQYRFVDRGVVSR
jgi:branched-subunit amino acid aminotransferase/4-amino-4-deoxychorismate lyase